MNFNKENYRKRREAGVRGQEGLDTPKRGIITGMPEIEHSPVGSRKEIRQHTKHGPRGRQARAPRG